MAYRWEILRYIKGEFCDHNCALGSDLTVYIGTLELATRAIFLGRMSSVILTLPDLRYNNEFEASLSYIASSQASLGYTGRTLSQKQNKTTQKKAKSEKGNKRYKIKSAKVKIALHLVIEYIERKV